MDVNHINPIIESFMTVMPQIGMQDVKRLGISVKDRAIESPGVVIIVGLVGDIKGNIIYGMSNDDAKKIASDMMMGKEVAEFDELAQSAVSELTNMLTATVATNYFEQGINVNISTPTLIYGEFIANASIDKVLCIQMQVNEAIVEVNVSLEKNTI